jgi:hypothetical protein
MTWTGKSIINNGSPAYHKVSWTNSITGVTNPKFKDQIKKGMDATTGMTAYLRTVRHIDGDLLIETNSGLYARRQGFIMTSADPPTGNYDSLSSAEAIRDASAAFFRQARNAQRAVQGIVILGELAQTVRMLKGNTSSIMRLFIDWRNRLSRRRPRSAKERLKRAADAWLEFQFGWRPLVSDAKSILSSYSKPRVVTRVISASGSKDWHLIDSDTTTITTGPMKYDEKFWKYSRACCYFKGGISIEVGAVGELQRWGFTPSDFVPSLYELLPWSFLFDYFTDLGATVEGLCFPKQSIRWSCRSVVKEYRNRYFCGNARKDPTLSSGVKRSMNTPQETEWIRKEVVRTKQNPDVPWPKVQVPGFGPKWINLAALYAAKSFRY